MNLHTITIRPGETLGTYAVWCDDVKLEYVTDVKVNLRLAELPIVTISLIALVDGEFVTTTLATQAGENEERGDE